MMRYFIQCIFLVYISGILKAGELIFPDIEGFTKILREDVYYSDNLYDLINGGSDAFIEYGFSDLHLCEYKSGDIIITVEAYNHQNISNAFGIYASERAADYHFVNYGTEGYQEDGILHFFQEQYYIKINGFSESGKDVNTLLPEIARAVSNSIGNEMKYPDIILKFPAEGKVPYTEGYVNNHYLGYGFLNNVYFVKYNKGNEITFFIVDHINEEKARESLHEYITKMNIPDDALQEGIYTIDDPYAGKIFLSKSGHFLLGTLKCPDIKVAQKIFTEFK